MRDVKLRKVVGDPLWGGREGRAWDAFHYMTSPSGWSDTLLSRADEILVGTPDVLLDLGRGSGERGRTVFDPHRSRCELDVHV